MAWRSPGPARAKIASADSAPPTPIQFFTRARFTSSLPPYRPIHLHKSVTNSLPANSGPIHFMSDAGLIDPALQDNSTSTPTAFQTSTSADAALDPALSSVSTQIEASLPPSAAQPNKPKPGQPQGDVHPSVVQEALDGLVSMVKQDNEELDELATQPLEEENQKLRRELGQAKQHIFLLQQELNKYRPSKLIQKPIKPVPPPKAAPQRRGSIPPNESTLQKYRDELGGWTRTTYDPATIPHINNFGQNERQETNLRVAFADLNGHVPDEQEWKAWIAERLRLVDDVLDGAKTWAQQPDEYKNLAMDVAEKRWPALMLCDESRWKAVEFLSRRQEQRLKKPRVPKGGKKREASEALGTSHNGHDGSVSESPAPDHHHDENGDIDISGSPSGKRPRLDDLLVDPQLQQLLQQHQAEEEAAGRHGNFVLGDAAALVAQRENGDIPIDGAEGQKDGQKEAGEFDNLDPALHAATSSSFADATALVEGLEGLQGIEGMEGIEGLEGLEGIEGIEGEYQLGDELALDYDSVTDQLQAQIQNSLNDSIHSQLGSLNQNDSAKKKKTGGAHKGPEPGTPEAEALLKQHSHKSLEQFRAMGGRILGDLCGAAGLYSRSGSIQQKAKRIHEFFTTGANLLPPSETPAGSDFNPADDHSNTDPSLTGPTAPAHTQGFNNFGDDLQVGNAAGAAQPAAAAEQTTKSPSPVQAGDVEV